MDIPCDLAIKIKEICDEGDVLIEMGELKDAFNNFSEALALVPEPKPDYEITASILAGLGDLYFHAKRFAQGHEVLSDAMHCVGAIGSPFLHMRLGQCQFELGNEERAADELARAYMGAGKEIFEQEDPKYFEFVKTKLDAPMSGEW
ncbi:tetratricopeptide repeat protein [Achromobacter marplatensis]|uniref:tetratricopeptide repeat protein n=1 Tax=Achromobacter marplatensis TaxID=470868 RepID=UPI0028EC9599|nr:tetratricopeptide repeat protein [Achromobacter marplatensis]